MKRGIVDYLGWGVSRLQVHTWAALVLWICVDPWTRGLVFKLKTGFLRDVSLSHLPKLFYDHKLAL
jgi:hypothetical protein